MNTEPIYVHADVANLIGDMAEEVYETNVANGWFDADRTFGDDIALLHSEVSEMLEAYRDGQFTTTYAYESTAQSEPMEWTSEYPPTHEEFLAAGYSAKPVGMPSEAADVLVRLLDTCKRYNIDLFAEWRRKMDYNRTRGHRHGGKRL